MKRLELIAGLREVLQANANARAWLDDSDARINALIEQLDAPPAEHAATPEPERPASDFVVQESDGREEWASPRQRGVVDFNGDPRSKSVANAITPAQLGLIKSLAREAGVDYQVECAEQFDGCKVEDLSKRAASAFIGYLQTVKEQGAEFRKVG